jgi:hypothetical protein
MRDLRVVFIQDGESNQTGWTRKHREMSGGVKSLTISKDSCGDVFPDVQCWVYGSEIEIETYT